MSEIDRAAGSISIATAMVVVAGAGMSRGAGLPDLDDPACVEWPHPALAKLEMMPHAIFDARWFDVHPGVAWGFWSAHIEACRRARPHAGHLALARWSEGMPAGTFVITSCGDGQFQRATFHADRVVEANGALEWLQCTEPCPGGPFPGGLLDVDVDEETGYALPPFPMCPRCAAIARPNLALGTDDRAWDPSRAHEQEDRANDWLAELRGGAGKKLVVVECGVRPRERAMRARAERIAAAFGATLVRIDESDASAPPGAVGIVQPPMEALVAIDQALATRFPRATPTASVRRPRFRPPR